MPNRIIKDSIRTSKSINAMSDFQFRLWAYLITYVDDYGRGSADPELLKGFVFPRRKGVTEVTIQKTLAELATAGSVILYEVDGEPYLCFPNWSEHQAIRNKVSKYPAPEDGEITITGNCSQLKSNEINCKHTIRIRNPETREALSARRRWKKFRLIAKNAIAPLTPSSFTTISRRAVGTTRTTGRCGHGSRSC